MDEDPKYQDWSKYYLSPVSSATAGDTQSYSSSSRYYDTPDSSSISRTSYDSSGSFDILTPSTPPYHSSVYSLPSSMALPGMNLYPQYGSVTGNSWEMALEKDPEIRHTPSTLGWTRGTELIKLYKFKVPKGKEPYFELLSQWTPVENTPAKVYLDPAPRGFKKNQYPCLYPPVCHAKVNVFSRPADLERHYRQYHGDEKESFPCDYPRCGRSQEPFTRKDHYRDHLRDYHMEDIGAAKGDKSKDKKKWEQAQKTWLAQRKINPRYWRCARCLVKCRIQEVGWNCPVCKTACEEERIKTREKIQEQEQEERDRVDLNDSLYPFDNPALCSACHGTMWVEDGYSGQPCQLCSPGYPEPSAMVIG